MPLDATNSNSLAQAFTMREFSVDCVLNRQFMVGGSGYTRLPATAVWVGEAIGGVRLTLTMVSIGSTRYGILPDYERGLHDELKDKS